MRSNKIFYYLTVIQHPHQNSGVLSLVSQHISYSTGYWLSHYTELQDTSFQWTTDRALPSCLLNSDKTSILYPLTRPDYERPWLTSAADSFCLHKPILKATYRRVSKLQIKTTEEKSLHRYALDFPTEVRCAGEYSASNFLSPIHQSERFICQLLLQTDTDESPAIRAEIDEYSWGMATSKLR